MLVSAQIKRRNCWFLIKKGDSFKLFRPSLVFKSECFKQLDQFSCSLTLSELKMVCLFIQHPKVVKKKIVMLMSCSFSFSFISPLLSKAFYLISCWRILVIPSYLTNARARIYYAATIRPKQLYSDNKNRSVIG